MRRFCTLASVLALALSAAFSAGVLILAGPAGALANTGGLFTSVPPTRLLDTRDNIGGSALGPNGTLSLTVGGVAPLPATSAISAVVLNVTVTQPTAAGYLTVWANDGTQPNASNLNFSAGETVPNLVVAPIGSDGKIAFFNGSAGTSQVLADVSGYYSSGTAGSAGAFVSIPPTRLLDTRTPFGGSPVGPATPNGSVAVQVAGQGSGASAIPSGVTEAVLNITATGPSALGYISAYASGSSAPNSSNLNFSAGETVPNLVVAPIGPDGRIALFNGSSGTTQILADVLGYFVPGSPSAVGATQALAPARMLDTRDGEGGPNFFDFQNGADGVPVGSNATYALPIAGRSGVPSGSIQAVILNVTVTGAAGSGFITAWPAGSGQPNVSNLNFSAGQTVPNLVVVPVGPDGSIDLFNGSGGTVNLIADVAGYVLATPGVSPVANIHVLDCSSPSDKFDLEVPQLLLECDSFNFLYNMTWSTWGATTATGTGSIAVFNDNTGFYESASVQVTLSAPCAGNYGIAAFTYPGGAPAGYPTSYTLSGACA